MQLPDLGAFDTLPKLLVHNARRHGSAVALREKEFGIWNAFTWADYRARVEALALGLLAAGVGRGDVVAIIGRNRPQWLFAELAAQSVGALSLGIYQDALAREVFYLLDYAKARVVFAEDEEQVDKLLEIADELPSLARIVFDDPRGMRKHGDPRLVDVQAFEAAGAGLDSARFETEVARGLGDDVAILCTTSGTTSNPKLAMLPHRRFLEHISAYLRADPREEDDEYVSILPLPWIMEQIYVVAMPLLSRIRVSFPEDETTAMHDLREIGPTHVLLAPRVWEQLSADVHARILDANPVNQRLFRWGVAEGLKALDQGRLAQLADLVVLGALRDRLGFAKVKSAATGGAALGPDTFRFFLAMGVPLRQLYGQTELAGAYTLQDPADGVDFDSSGKPFDNTEIRIVDPDPSGLGEIQTRHTGMFAGYYLQPGASAATLTPDGWMRTGDAGYLDPKGRLVVVDRVADIATTSTGDRFSPQFIENKLKFSPYIGECVVLGNGRPTITAIICIRFSMVAKWAEARGLAFTGYANLSAHQEAYDLITGEVSRVNQSLPEAQRIRRFLLLYKELDADDGELTRTRKVRRKVIDQRYGNLIEALYSDADRVTTEAEVTFEDGRTGAIRAEMAIRDLAPAEAQPTGRAA